MTSSCCDCAHFPESCDGKEGCKPKRAKELKPCPFQKAGETHELEWVDVGALKWVRCKTCNAQGPCEEDKQRAEELWNTRYKRTCNLNEARALVNPDICGDGWDADARRDSIIRKVAELCGAEVVDE